MKKIIVNTTGMLCISAGLSGCFFGLFGSGDKVVQNKPTSAPNGQTPPQQQQAQAAPQPATPASTSAPTSAPATSEASEPMAPTTAAAPSGPALEPSAVGLSEKAEVAVVKTKYGNFIILLNDKEAPRHSENFRRNIRTGLYNGTTFHRVIPSFIVQGGDPFSKDNDRSNDGLGGSGITVQLEKKLPHKRGSVAMARPGDKVNKDRRSNGAQFYICLNDAPYLDAKYSVFGKVIAGMNIVEKISSAPRDDKDNPKERIEMTVELKKYKDAME